MALELELKFRRTREDDSSSSVSELRIAKDRAGPLFLSTETHSMFVLTAYLKGYKRSSFKIKISEDGKEISISGEKPIQQMIMIGWGRMKNQVEIIGFKKVFKIPNGVVLDRIKAKYDEEESILRILMPKFVKGISGVQIEEVKEAEYGESSHKALEETKVQQTEKPRLEIENGYGESVKEDAGKDEIQAMKNLELGQKVEDHIPKKIAEASQRGIEVSEEDKVERKKQKEIEEPKFEDEDRVKERVDEEISMERLEALETTMEGGESKKELGRAIGVNGEDKIERKKQKQIEETKFEVEDRVKERLEEEFSKESLEVVETTTEGRGSEKELGRGIEASREDRVERKKRKQIEEPKFEAEDRVKERLKEKVSMESLEAMETTTEGGGSEKELHRGVGVSEEDRAEKKKQEEIEEPTFEAQDGVRKRVEEEISTKRLEELDTTTKGVESEKKFVKGIGATGEDRDERKIQEQIEERKVEVEDKVKEIVEEEISMERLEALKTTTEGGEFKKDLGKGIGVSREDRDERKIQEQIEEPKFEVKERVEEEISMERLETLETTTEGGESKRELGWGIGVSGEDRDERKKQEQIEKPKFEAKDRVKGRVEEEIKMERLALKTTTKGGESEKELGRGIGVSGEDKAERKKQEEIKEPKFEAEDRDRKRVEEEISTERLEALETTTEEGEFEKKLDRVIEASREDRDERKMQEQIGKPKVKAEDKVKERVEEEISMERLEALESTTEGGESEKEIGREIGVGREDKDERKIQEQIKDPKFEAQDIVKERMEEEISMERLKASKTTIEGGESKKELGRGIGVSGEDKDERKKQEQIGKPMFEAKDRVKERMEEEIRMERQALETTTERGESEKELGKGIGVSGEDRVEKIKQEEIEKPKFEVEDGNKERVEEEISTKRLETLETIIEEGESKKKLGRGIGASWEDRDERKIQEQIEEPKVEAEDRVKEIEEDEISTERLEALETTTKGGEFEEELGKGIGVSGEDKVEREKQKQIEELKFEVVNEVKERVEEEISTKRLEALETSTEGGESDMELGRGIGISEEDIKERKRHEQNEEPKFKVEERVEEEISMERLKALETTIEGGESEKELGRGIVANGEDRDQRKLQEQIEEPNVEAEDKVEEDTSMETLEALETTIEGGEFEKEIGRGIGVSGEDKVERGKQEQIEELKFEADDRVKERVEEIISTERLEALETTTERGESKKKLVRGIGISEEDRDERKKQEQIEELKFKAKDRVKERVEEEISLERLKALETITEGGEFEMAVSGGIGLSREDRVEKKKQKEIKELRFEAEKRVKKKAEEEISMEQLEALETINEGGESKRELGGGIGVSGEGRVERKKHKEIEELKFEDEERVKKIVEKKISMKQVKALDTIMEGGEPKRELGGGIGINREDRIERKKQKEIEELKFEAEERVKRRVEEEICKERFEALETTADGRESEMDLDRGIGVSGEDRVEKKEPKQIEEPKFEVEDRVKERVEEEFSMDRLEALETTTEGGDYGKELDWGIGVSGEYGVEKQRQKQIDESKFEAKDREMVEEESSMKRLEALEATSEGGESEKELGRGIGVSGEDRVEKIEKKQIEEPKLEAEKRVDERVEEETSVESFEALETTMEEEESKKELGRGIGVRGDSKVERTKQKEIEETKFETEDKNKERVEEENSMERLEALETTMESKKELGRGIRPSGEDIIERTKQKEVEEFEFETEDRDKEIVKEEIGKKGLEAVETTIGEFPEQIPEPFQSKESDNFIEMVEGGESEKDLARGIAVRREDKNEGLVQREIEEPKFRTEDRDKGSVKEEIGKERFEAIEINVKEFPKQAPKEPFQMKKIDSVVERMEGEKIIKPKEIEEYKFGIVKEETSKEGSQEMEFVDRDFGTELPKIPLEEIEKGKEKMAKKESRKAEYFMEEEIEEPKKMNEEARMVVEKDYKEAEQKANDESSVKTSEKGIEAPIITRFGATEPSEVEIPSSTQQSIVEEREKSDRSTDKQKSETYFPKMKAVQQEKEDGHEGSQVSSLHDSELDLQESTKPGQEVEQLKSSKPEFPVDLEFIKYNHEVIGQEESHGRQEIGGEEVDELRDEVQLNIFQDIEELKDIQVEASEKEKPCGEGDEVLVKIFQEIEELKDILVEANGEEEVAKQGDEVQVDVSQEIEELKDIQMEASEEEKVDEQGDEFQVEVSQEIEELKDIQMKASEEEQVDEKEVQMKMSKEIEGLEEILVKVNEKEKTTEREEEGHVEILQQLGELKDIEVEACEEEKTDEQEEEVHVKISQQLEEQKDIKVEACEEEKPGEQEEEVHVEISQQLEELKVIEVETCEEENVVEQDVQVKIYQEIKKLKDILVEADEEVKIDKQEEEVHMEVSEQLEELEDIKLEASEGEKIDEQEARVKITQETKEQQYISIEESEEENVDEQEEEVHVEISQPLKELKDIKMEACEEEKTDEQEKEVHEEISQQLKELKVIEVETCEEENVDEKEDEVQVKISQEIKELKDILVEANEEVKIDEEEKEAYVEVSKQLEELEDIKLEVSEEEKVDEQEARVKITQERKELQYISIEESEEENVDEQEEEVHVEITQPLEELKDNKMEAWEEEKTDEQEKEVHEEISQQLKELKVIEVETCEEENVDEKEDEVQVKISQEIKELKDILVEANEEVKIDEEEKEAYVEVSEQLEELEDIQLEASEEEKFDEQEDEVRVKISQGIEEEENADEQGEEADVEISQELEELKDVEVEVAEEEKRFCSPMVIAGSVFLASLIVFFVRQVRAKKR